jgi:hypothetical protein
MKTLALLPTLLLSTGLVSAECYRSGFPGNKDFAARSLDPECAKLTRTFRPAESRGSCLQVDETTHWLLEIWNQSSDVREVSMDTCRHRLGNEIWGCDRGGSSTIDGIRFRYVHVFLESGDLRRGPEKKKKKFPLWLPEIMGIMAC